VNYNLIKTVLQIKNLIKTEKIIISHISHIYKKMKSPANKSISRSLFFLSTQLVSKCYNNRNHRLFPPSGHAAPVAGHTFTRRKVSQSYHVLTVKCHTFSQSIPLLFAVPLVELSLTDLVTSRSSLVLSVASNSIFMLMVKTSMRFQCFWFWLLFVYRRCLWYDFDLNFKLGTFYVVHVVLLRD
jgi:hypothetical protein